MTQIGTLREKPLHASLKEWYRQPGDLVEQPVDGFVVDLVREDLLIEIQTASFSKMRRKLETLIDDGHRVRVVHPIALDKWIVKVKDDGTIIDRRLSPRHGQVVDVFGELVGVSQLVDKLEIEVVLVRIDELRRHVPGKAWRRKGWVVAERHLVEVVEHVVLQDFSELIPDSLPEPFTTSDLAKELGCRLRTAQQMAYCLKHAGVIEAVGKEGNRILYSVSHCS